MNSIPFGVNCMEIIESEPPDIHKGLGGLRKVGYLVCGEKDTSDRQTIQPTFQDSLPYLLSNPYEGLGLG
jgi:hypothetical protein